MTILGYVVAAVDFGLLLCAGSLAFRSKFDSVGRLGAGILALALGSSVLVILNG